MAEGDELLRTIEAAHAAALDEGLWPEALTRLARLFGAVGATLEDFGKRPLGLRYLRTAGLPPQAETGYLEHYQHYNPRADYAFRHLSDPILCDYVLIDESAMDRDAYYARYLKELDLRYFMSGQIADTPENQAIVSIQRTRRQGHVDKRDIERMQQLLPHLRLAYDMATRLRHAETAVRSLEGALEWLSDGVALVRADGMIAYANRAFQDIARRNDGIRIRKGAFDLPTDRARTLLSQAIGDGARLRQGDDGGIALTDFLVARGSDGPPYLVSIRPLAARSIPHADAVAIVFVRDPAARDTAAVAFLREYFGLTEAEADLARALQAGRSLGDYARDRALSLNTVYTHMRRIKEKTRCRRMPELIRKLNDLQTPLRAC
jgi:DNA-binding CsgD family transcriptional regulator